MATNAPYPIEERIELSDLDYEVEEAFTAARAARANLLRALRDQLTDAIENIARVETGSLMYRGTRDDRTALLNAKLEDAETLCTTLFRIVRNTAPRSAARMGYAFVYMFLEITEGRK